MDARKVLQDWAVIYIKNKDVVQKSITSIDENVDGFDFIVRKTSGDQFFLVRPEFSDVDEVVVKGADKQLGLVILNIRENLNKVIASWDKLCRLKGLCIYFVNPKSSNKWLLFPYTHEQITERAALKRGLESLFSMVEAYK